MFKYTPVAVQVNQLRRQNAQLEKDVKQNRADLDFVAAMTDVEIPDEESEEE